MEKIIVTGGSGFIGSNLVDFLIKRKLFVINLDKLTYSSNKYKNKLRNNRNYLPYLFAASAPAPAIWNPILNFCGSFSIG